jgi:hypothetical protein
MNRDWSEESIMILSGYKRKGKLLPTSLARINRQKKEAVVISMSGAILRMRINELE